MPPNGACIITNNRRLDDFIRSLPHCHSPDVGYEKHIPSRILTCVIISEEPREVSNARAKWNHQWFAIEQIKVKSRKHRD
jgi:hypothetical protein